MARGFALGVLIWLAGWGAAPTNAEEFQNVGHAGANFLQVPVDAHAAALGNAAVALTTGVRGLWSNPGALALGGRTEVAFSYVDWLVDTRLVQAGASVSVGSLGVLAVNLTSLSMDDMEVTTEFQPQGTGERFGAGGLSVGLGFGSMVTDRFSYGVVAKYVREYIWDNSASALAFDVGSVYRADVLNLRIGMTISNFGGTLTMEGDQVRARLEEEAAEDVENNPQGQRLSQDYSLPQSFTVGVAIDPWRTDRQRLSLMVATNDPIDNATRFGFGVEYEFMGTLALRAGWKHNYEEQGLSAGVGVRVATGNAVSRLDYAYTDFGILKAVHHLSYGLSF